MASSFRLLIGPRVGASSSAVGGVGGLLGTNGAATHPDVPIMLMISVSSFRPRFQELVSKSAWLHTHACNLPNLELMVGPRTDPSPAPKGYAIVGTAVVNVRAVLGNHVVLYRVGAQSTNGCAIDANMFPAMRVP